MTDSEMQLEQTLRRIRGLFDSYETVTVTEDRHLTETPALGGHHVNRKVTGVTITIVASGDSTDDQTA